MASSMQGSLGIGANITAGSPEEFTLARRLIAAYAQVQPTIVQGDLYRLISPRNGSEFSATQTVNADKSQSAASAFIHSTQQGRLFPLLKLKGLGPSGRLCAQHHRRQGAQRHACGGQRRVVDEPRPGSGRQLPRRFSRRSLPA